MCGANRKFIRGSLGLNGNFWVLDRIVSDGLVEFQVEEHESSGCLDSDIVACGLAEPSIASERIILVSFCQRQKKGTEW